MSGKVVLVVVLKMLSWNYASAVMAITFNFLLQHHLICFSSDLQSIVSVRVRLADSGEAVDRTGQRVLI